MKLIGKSPDGIDSNIKSNALNVLNQGTDSNKGNEGLVGEMAGVVK